MTSWICSDMEQPLAVLAKNGNHLRGSGRAPDPKDMQVEKTEVVLGAWPKKSTNLQEERVQHQFSKQLGVILFWKMELPLEYWKPKPAIQQPLMS